MAQKVPSDLKETRVSRVSLALRVPGDLREGMGAQEERGNLEQREKW